MLIHRGYASTTKGFHTQKSMVLFSWHQRTTANFSAHTDGKYTGYCPDATYTAAASRKKQSTAWALGFNIPRVNAVVFRQLYPFPSQRFHALLNSLFKVLCNFPSRYLFAIGLVAVFSLR